MCVRYEELTQEAISGEKADNKKCLWQFIETRSL